MKLHRFTALDNHRAMFKVYETLGPEALVYSTRRIPNGVEILAGLEQEETKASTGKQKHDSVSIQNVGPDANLLDKLNIQLQMMDENIQTLLERINTLQQAVVDKKVKKISHVRHFFKTIGRIRQLLKEGNYGRHAT